MKKQTEASVKPKRNIMKKYILQNKGTLMITLLSGAIFSLGSTFIALILKDAIDVSLSGDLDRFFTIVMQSIIFIVAVGLCYWLYSKFSKKFIGRISTQLRNDAFSGIFKKNISDFKSVNSADYISALTNDVKNMEENYFNPLLLCLQNILMFISSFVIMIYLSPLVTLCLFAAMFVLILIPSLFKNSIQNKQDSFSKNQSQLTVAIKDFLQGFEVIRSYKMNSYTVSAFEEKNNTVYTAKYALDKVLAAVEALSSMLGIAVQCSVLFVSAHLIITGKITAGALVGLVQVSGSIVMPIQILSQNIPKIGGCKPIIERLDSFINYQDSTFTGTIKPTFNSAIAVKNLHFGYGEGEEIIKGIDFSFEQGKKYALVGKSGCGKTTLINLLTGYYSQFNGEITYDGTDIRELNIDILNEMSSVIHQNVYMFDESIEDNICLHKTHKQVDLQKALTMSGVEIFLGEEKNLSTLVGENGNNLSGGQRQRVAVARALVQGKSILILDEGTSAVDMQTAYDIENQLLKITDLTLITITHSLNSELLADYDTIVFMEDGIILEADSFENLINMKQSFYDFYSLKKA